MSADPSQPLMIPIGKLADLIYDKQQELRVLNEGATALKAEIDGLQEQAIASLEYQGLQSAKGTKASISITARDVVQIDDIDKFHDYMMDTRQPFLQQARPASRACLELIASGEDIPGLRVFSLQSLSTRKV